MVFMLAELICNHISEGNDQGSTSSHLLGCFITGLAPGLGLNLLLAYQLIRSLRFLFSHRLRD